MDLTVRQFSTGGDRNFGYLAASEGRAAVIDPSPRADAITAYVRERELQVDYIFVTHRHPDHTAGSPRAAEAFGRVPLHFGDTDMPTGLRVEHGARFPLGITEITLLHTPGHTADSICLLAGDALFTGDTLFVGKVGGSDLGEGARAQYRSLHDVILALPDDTRVFPGHDYGRAPQSTIGAERQGNPFLLQRGRDAFIHLKRTWPEYKRVHGIS